MPSSAFGKPNRMYDAVLPLRLLLLKLWDKKVYRLVRLLMLLLFLLVLLLLLTLLLLPQVCLLMDHKDDQSPGQQRRQTQIAELIRNTWGFSKDFSVNEVRSHIGNISCHIPYIEMIQLHVTDCVTVVNI